MKAGAGAPDLSPILMAAFARYQPHPLPRWYRAIRLGIDYALVNSGPPETDAQADTYAWLCIALANNEAMDPPGDPPATCAAHEAADRMGPPYGRAFWLLGTIRDCADRLSKRGIAVPALPAATMRTLQCAARAERVPESELAAVLEAAGELAKRLGMAVLRLRLR